ncbi:MAG: hypothetical protein ACYC3X_23870 [Pirellulaceae bacterium]
MTFEQPPWLPWNIVPNTPGIRERLSRILDNRKHRFVGDVASFYLPYIEEAIAFDSDIRILCLKRPREEIVATFCATLDRVSPFPIDHWSKQPAAGWTHDFLRTRMYPQYDSRDRIEGIGLYWDEYYTRAEFLERKYPDQVRIWDTEALTQEDGVRDVLTFAGIPLGDQTPMTGRKPPTPDLAQLPRGPAAQRFTHPLDPRKCAVLVPFTGFIHPECDEGLKELERRGYQVRRVGGYAAIDQGRNQMATDALLDGFEETLWIDSDIGFHPDFVDQLRSHALDLVCGIYPQKGKRALACHVMPGSPSTVFGQRGGLIELLYAGAGFLLIRRNVYLALLQQLHLAVCNERFGHPTIPFFMPMIREIEDGYWYLAEDYAFCQRVRQCGFRIYADTTIRLWHIGTYRYGWEDAGLERQRFASFTLNFGAWPSASQATVSEKPASLANFSALHAWPERRPEVPSFPIRQWLQPGTQELMVRSIDSRARLVLQLGAQTGQLTRFLAGLAPGATVLAVDTWQSLPTEQMTPESILHLPHLFDVFLVDSWQYRDQIVPVRLVAAEALQRIAELGLNPDIICLPESDDYQDLATTLDSVLDLFPQTAVVGDGLANPETARAVADVMQRRNVRFEPCGSGWRLLQPKPEPEGRQ